MKQKVLNILSWLLTLVFLIFKPLSYYWNRIFYLAIARTKIRGLKSSVQFDGSVNIVGTAKIMIADSSRIGKNVELGTEEKGTLDIGSRVRLNRGTTVFAYDNISIGDDTLIGEFVTIRDANHGMVKGETIHSQPHIATKINIGKDVWIGRGVVILPGVNIGDGSIIGANSVVTRSIPENVIALGSPAKVLRNR